MTSSRTLILLALVTAFSFGGIAHVAVSGHYHTYNNIEHGLVHGSSDWDGSYFSRTYGFYFGGVNYCAVGDFDEGTYAAGYTYNADLCSLWSSRYEATPDECRGFSYNRVADYAGGWDYVSGHYHDAHSPPTYSCEGQIS